MATNVSSGIKTASGVITTNRAILDGVDIITDNTNDVTLVVYDNESAASGTVLFGGKVVGTTEHKTINNINARAADGLYADLTVAGAGTAQYVIRYR